MLARVVVGAHRVRELFVSGGTGKKKIFATELHGRTRKNQMLVRIAVGAHRVRELFAAEGM